MGEEPYYCVLRRKLNEEIYVNVNFLKFFFSVILESIPLILQVTWTQYDIKYSLECHEEALSFQVCVHAYYIMFVGNAFCICTRKRKFALN